MNAHPLLKDGGLKSIQVTINEIMEVEYQGIELMTPSLNPYSKFMIYRHQLCSRSPQHVPPLHPNKYS